MALSFASKTPHIAFRLNGMIGDKVKNKAKNHRQKTVSVYDKRLISMIICFTSASSCRMATETGHCKRATYDETTSAGVQNRLKS